MKKLCIFFSFLLAVSAQSAQLTVHAAASLTDAMKQIAATYEKESGDHLRLNFDASSILERQIEEGAPADIFLSADEAKMDQLEKAGRLAPGTRKVLLANTLVIVVPQESTMAIKKAEDLAGPEVKKIALAQPASVPAKHLRTPVSHCAGLVGQALGQGRPHPKRPWRARSGGKRQRRSRVCLQD